jgi:hypothetical protein
VRCQRDRVGERSGLETGPVRIDSLCFCLWKDRLPHRLHRVCDLEWRLPLRVVSEPILERLDDSSCRRFPTPKPPADRRNTHKEGVPCYSKSDQVNQKRDLPSATIPCSPRCDAMRCDPSSRRGPGREGEVRQGRVKGCGREGRERERTGSCWTNTHFTLRTLSASVACN